MITVSVYGSSDDLIIITGNDGQIAQQITANYNENTRITLFGYIIEAEYSTGGTWLFDIIEAPENGSYTKYSVGERTDFNDYSQVIEIEQSLSDSITKLS